MLSSFNKNILSYKKKKKKESLRIKILNSLILKQLSLDFFIFFSGVYSLYFLLFSLPHRVLGGYKGKHTLNAAYLTET